MQATNQPKLPDLPVNAPPPEASGAELVSTDGPCMKKLKSIIKPEYLKVLNLIACTLLTYGAVMRFVNCFTGADGFNIWFFMTTFYFFIFIFITACIVAHETNKFSVYCRTYFNFLDKTFGRGVFLSFLAITTLERRDGKGELLVCIVVGIISVLNMILGFGDAKKKLASLPWEKAAGGSAEPASGQAQPKKGGNGLAYDAKTDSYQVQLDGAQTRAAAVQGVKEGMGMSTQNNNDPYAQPASSKYQQPAPARPSSVPLSQPIESNRNASPDQPQQVDIEKQQPQAQENNSKPLDVNAIELEDDYDPYKT